MSSTRNISNDHSAARCNHTQALIVLDSCHSVKDFLSIHSISEDVRELESTICFDSDEESEFSLSFASFASYEFAEHESEDESSCSGQEEEEEVVDLHSSLISRLDPHTVTQKPPNRSSTTREKENRTEEATDTGLICPSMIVMKKKEGDAADDDVNNFDFELRHSDSLKKVIGNGHRVVKSVLSENLSRSLRWSVDCPAVKDELLLARLGKARLSHHGCTNEDTVTKATRKQQQQRLPDDDDDLSVGEEEEEGIVDDILLHSDSRHKISNRGRRMVHTSLRSPLKRKKTDAFIAARCA